MFADSNMVLSFKCSCPLMVRLGTIEGCENHLDTCGYVLQVCKLRCGVVLQRDELKVHEEKCPQRMLHVSIVVENSNPVSL